MKKFFEEFSKKIAENENLAFAMSKGIPYEVNTNKVGDKYVVKLKTQSFKVEEIEGEKKLFIWEDGKPKEFRRTVFPEE